MKYFSVQNRRTGFTLIEIMLVVVIIGILAAVIGPKLSGKTKTAQVSATKSSIKGLETALGMFEVKAGRFPSTDEGLESLITKPSDLSDDEWDGPYIKDKSVPLDAFKEEFIYRQPGELNEEYDIVSKGPDKREGTDDDITNAPAAKK